MLSLSTMKKPAKKALVLARQTVRTLHSLDLSRAVGGIETSVGGNGHPYTCGCHADPE
jgi:hypothetical protein